MYFAGAVKESVTYFSPRNRKITRGSPDLQPLSLICSNLFTYTEQTFSVPRCMKCSDVLNCINQFNATIDSRLKSLQASLVRVREDSLKKSRMPVIHLIRISLPSEHLCVAQEIQFQNKL